MPRIKTTTKFVYCVRHCESVENADGIRRGDASELTELGRLQAEAVAERMKALDIDALISSPSVRAMATAKAIERATGLSSTENCLFEERQRPAATLGRHTTDPRVRRVHTKSDVIGVLFDTRTLPDAESMRDMLPSIQEAFVNLQQHSAERICIVTHNTRLRLMHSYVSQEGKLHPLDLLDTWRRAYNTLDLDNGGITCFRYGDVHKRPDTFLWQHGFTNDISHLQKIKT